MPIIGDRVEIERKPKLGGGGPGKIPHRRGYGGGDDGDHGNSGDFRSREQRMRRYRVGMTLCIISVTSIFVLLTMVYVFRMGKGRFDEDAHRWVRDWIPLTLPYFQLWTNSLVLLLSSATLELARRSMVKKEEFTAMGIVPPRLKRDLPWLGITVFLGFCFWQDRCWYGTFSALRELFWLPIQAVRCFISSPALTPFTWLEDWLC